MQKTPAEKIWLPGQGVVDMGPMKVHRALQAYDDRLMFGRNEDTGDWCAFVKMPHGQAPVPVIGFGRELPTPEDAVKRCDAANTRRHSSQLLDMVTRDEIKRQEIYAKQREELAEVYADIMKEAKGVKAPQIYVPRGI